MILFLNFSYLNLDLARSTWRTLTHRTLTTFEEERRQRLTLASEQRHRPPKKDERWKVGRKMGQDVRSSRTIYAEKQGSMDG